ncbi:MAG: hypothetical protein LBN29_11795, partial [Mediterranea sp.]|nr:hypothetical protein [Mediterranea sp.]
FYHLRGDNARALAYIEEAIDSIRRRFDREYQSDCETITMLGGDAADIPSENRDLAEYMRFVEAFRRMLETGRVEP